MEEQNENIEEDNEKKVQVSVINFTREFQDSLLEAIKNISLKIIEIEKRLSIIEKKSELK